MTDPTDAALGELPDPDDPPALRAFLDRAEQPASPIPGSDAADRSMPVPSEHPDDLIACVDLTCLDAEATEGRLVALCQRAVTPDPDDPTCPSVAAVCSWPDAVATMGRALHGHGVAVCSVAGGFPHGRQPVEALSAEVAAARAAGADEIDVPLHRGLLADRRDADVLARLRVAVDAAGDVPVKAILETAALSPAAARRAAWIAVLAGVRWLKTSTGQLAPGATVEAAALLADVAAAATARTGRLVGVKASGGIRTVEQAWQMARPVTARLGPVHRSRLRLGASGLLDALVAHRQRGDAGSGEFRAP